ncbi:MAG: hypothetical protein WD010_06800, partial [Nitriliruptor sp.]
MRRPVVSLLTIALVAATAFGLPSATPTPAVAQTSADPCAGAPRAPYVDVSDGGTHTPAIDCLHGLDAIRGRLVDAFEPGTTIRRDQMATIVAAVIEAAGGSLPSPGARFSDVDGNVHRDAIERFPMLRSSGLRGGVIYYDGQFDDARMNVPLALTAAEQG